MGLSTDYPEAPQASHQQEGAVARHSRGPASASRSSATMAKRMLIDAMHPEETRVVVLDGNRLDEFDFESSTKKQVKGNIYLAKITRVEPSLQAAFVDYGNHRHGFLAFSEIHPDYYKIPVGDREPNGLDPAHEEGETREDEPEAAGEEGVSLAAALPEPVPVPATPDGNEDEGSDASSL